MCGVGGAAILLIGWMYHPIRLEFNIDTSTSALPSIKERSLDQHGTHSIYITYFGNLERLQATLSFYLPCRRPF